MCDVKVTHPPFNKGHIMNYSESHLTRQQQIEQGANYTPIVIANIMAAKLTLNNTSKVLDPTVGKGSLIQAAIENGALEENCYGVDVDPIAIVACIERFPKAHFQVGDCLVDPITHDAFWEKPWNVMWSEHIKEKNKVSIFRLDDG